MSSGFLPLLLVLHLCIKFDMTIIASVILMKTSFLFKLWQRGMFSTRARVKVVSIPSIYPHKASKLSLTSKLYNNVALSSVFNKTLWHMRLGHPHDQVLHVLFVKFKYVSNKCTNSNYSCTHFLYGKMHKLPFPKSQFTASSPFELVHSDL